MRETGRETPFGRLYTPKSFPVQIPFLVGAFAGGPVAAWLVSKLLGGVSQNAQLFLYAAYGSIFFFGYALWASRLAALAFNTFGKNLLRLLFRWIVKKKNPAGIEDLLPTRERLEELVVRAQRAASSFLVVSIVIGFIGGIWIESLLVATGCVLWGWLLMCLGRRGYLPLPEASE